MPIITADSTLGGISGYANSNLFAEVGRASMAPGVPPYLFLDVGISSVPQTLVTRALPVSQVPRAISCDHTLSYFDDYYNRIHFTPSDIAYDGMVAASSRPLLIWNSYLTPKVFNSITVPDDLGVSITPPTGVSLPQTFTALQQWEFTVVAGLAGPPSFDSTISFDISGTDYGVSTSGRRLMVFPFPPNWNSPVDETFEWNSWVLPAGDGSEQTGSNWGNNPRRQFDYTVQLRGRSMQRFENMAFGWMHRNFGLPVWTEKTKITSAVSAGSNLVPCDTSLRSFVPKGFAMFYVDEETYEAFEIDTVTSGAITTTLPVQAAWPAGTRVYPVIPALLNENTSGGYQVDNLVIVPVHFECDPAQTPGNTDTTGSVPQYQGEEVYLQKPNWVSPLTFNVQAQRKVIDYRTGINAVYSTEGFSRTTRKHTWNLRNRQESADFRAWAGRREGVAIPVYMPTHNTDFTMVGPALATTANLDVDPNDYDLFASAHPARRDIIIQLRDGTYYIRRITDAQPFGSALRLTLDATFPQNIDPSQVKRVSLLGFYRLASNSVSIRWLTDEVGTAEVNLVTKRTP